jgi:hypothetical protein
VEIETNSKAPTTTLSIIQPIATTKLVSPLRSGIGLDIIPLLAQICIMYVQVITITIKSMEGSDKFVKEHVEPIDPPFIVFDSGIGPLEFLSITLFLTPHQMGINQEIIYIINTPHV